MADPVDDGSMSFEDFDKKARQLAQPPAAPPTSQTGATVPIQDNTPLSYEEFDKRAQELAKPKQTVAAPNAPQTTDQRMAAQIKQEYADPSYQGFTGALRSINPLDDFVRMFEGKPMALSKTAFSTAVENMVPGVSLIKSLQTPEVKKVEDQHLVENPWQTGLGSAVGLMATGGTNSLAANATNPLLKAGANLANPFQWQASLPTGSWLGKTALGAIEGGAQGASQGTGWWDRAKNGLFGTAAGGLTSGLSGILEHVPVPHIKNAALTAGGLSMTGQALASAFPETAAKAKALITSPTVALPVEVLTALGALGKAGLAPAAGALAGLLTPKVVEDYSKAPLARSQ